MYRPYWNYYHSLEGAKPGKILPGSNRAQLVFIGILLAVYVVAVVVGMWALS